MKLRSLHTTTLFEFYAPDYTTALDIPYVDVGISAGFPSPADDFIELTIDLNKHLIKHKDSTFFAKVKGHSMKDAGIFDGDVVVVDRSIDPSIGQIVLAEVDGEFTVRYLGQQQLTAANTEYESISFADAESVALIGVVTGSMRKFA